MVRGRSRTGRTRTGGGRTGGGPIGDPLGCTSGTWGTSVTSRRTPGRATVAVAKTRSRGSRHGRWHRGDGDGRWGCGETSPGLRLLLGTEDVPTLELTDGRDGRTWEDPSGPTTGDMRHLRRRNMVDTGPGSVRGGVRKETTQGSSTPYPRYPRDQGDIGLDTPSGRLGLGPDTGRGWGPGPPNDAPRCPCPPPDGPRRDGSMDGPYPHPQSLSPSPQSPS